MPPQMCDVVIAAAQAPNPDDFELLDEDDLPSSSGLLVLPHSSSCDATRTRCKRSTGRNASLPAFSNCEATGPTSRLTDSAFSASDSRS